MMDIATWIARKRRETRSMTIETLGRYYPTIYTYLHNAPNITNNGTNRGLIITIYSLENTCINESVQADYGFLNQI